MALEENAVLELIIEVHEAKRRIADFEAQFKAAMQQMGRAVKAGLDPSSAEFVELENRVKETGREFIVAGERGEKAMRELAQWTGKGSAEVVELRGKLAIARVELDKFNREGAGGLGNLVKGFNGVRTAIAAVATSIIALKLKDFIREGVVGLGEEEDAVARLNAALEATGGTAGRSTGQIIEMAERVRDTTTVTNTEVLNLAARLTDFTAISGATFDRSIAAIVDYSAKSKRGLEEIATVVGRATALGAEGLRGLRQIGIVFSEEQKQVLEDLISTGRNAEAAAVILGELERRSKGAAEALNDSLGGALKNLKDDLNELKQAFASGFAQELTAGANDAAQAMRDAREGAEEFGKSVGLLLKVARPFIALWDEIAGAIGISVSTSTRGLARLAAGVVKVLEVASKLPKSLGGEQFAAMAQAMAPVVAELNALALSTGLAGGELLGLGEKAETAAPKIEAVGGAAGAASAGIRTLTDDQKKLAESLGLTSSHLGKQVKDLLAVIAETRTHGKVTTEEKEIIKKALSELLTAYQTIGEGAPAELRKVAAEFGALSKQQEDAAKKLRDFVQQAYKDLAERNKALAEAAAPGPAKDEGADKIKERIGQLEDSLMLTIEEQNELDTLKNKLADITRDAANDFGRANQALGETRSAVELTAADIADMGSRMDRTAGSLGRLHPEFGKLDENVRRAGTAVERSNETARESVQVFDRLGNEVMAYEVGSDSAAEAVAGLAANQADFNAQGIHTADAMAQAADATAALGKETKTTEEKVRELAEQMTKSADAVKEIHGEATLAAIEEHNKKLRVTVDMYLEWEACLRRMGELAA